MNKFLIYICMIFSISIGSEASLVGEGELITGFSFYEDGQDIGLGLDYELDFNTARQNTRLQTNLNLTSGDVTLPNGHSKVFTDNEALIQIENKAEIRRKSINWLTSGVYKETKNNVTSVKSNDWQYLLGPTLEKKVRSDILMTADYKWSKSKINEIRSNNEELILILNKTFSTTNNLLLIGQQTCWNYDDALIKDDCIDSIRVDYAINGRANNFQVGYGLAKIAETQESIYSASFRHRFRDIGELSINFDREVSNLRSRAELITNTENASVSTITQSTSATYLKRFKRLTLRATSELVESNYESNETRDKEDLLDLNYNIGSVLCRTCSIGILYREGETGLGRYKEQLLSMNYPIRKDLMSIFSLRQTEDDVIGRYISMNISFVLNKKDQISAYQ